MASGTEMRERPRRPRGERTRRRLLDAGVEVFSERGYHTARVDDVVKKAATSHGTFYLYFRNKEALFDALVGEVSEQMRALATELPDLRDATALRAWLESFADVYDRYSPVIRAWTEAEMAESELGNLGSDLLQGVATIMAERISDEHTDLDPQLAALAIVAMIERYHYYALTDRVATTRSSTLDTLTTIITAGVHAD